ncbi:hypothetical protein [Methylobacterium tardum]|uniref:hypothetical protein n=1 Tax=Methylobacterium tardum TaxID=374432 RepID=UPI003612D94F
MNRLSADGARFWGLAFLGLGPPVCVALALTGPPGPALDTVGRLAHVALFLGLGLSALVLAARGRVALFALLCLPGSLAAATGPEGVVIALAALAAALLTPRPLTGRGRPARLAAATLAIALAVLARPACAPLAGMLLVPFPPTGRFGRFGRDRRHPRFSRSCPPFCLPSSGRRSPPGPGARPPRPRPGPLSSTASGLWPCW